MMQNDHIEILNEHARSLRDALKWLNRSLEICKKYNIEDLSPEGMDAFEGLTSRFARVCDLLFNKVFRTIFYLEQGEAGTWLDVLLFMEKENIINSARESRVLKELRNDIVHEYAVPDLKLIFKEVMNQSPVLLEYVNATFLKVEEINQKLNP